MNALFVLVLAASPTPVVRAVVYPDRAQVVRRGQLTCGQPLSFEQLPPSADPDSFRAQSDKGDVQGLRVESHPQTAAYAKQVAGLEDQLRALQQQERALQDQQRRDQGEMTTASYYSDVSATLISREMVETPNVNAWNAALDSSLQTRLRTNQDEVKLTGQLRALALKEAAIQAKLAQLSEAAQRNAFTAEVLVACPAGQSANVELSYMVGGAGWQPAYEARADEAGGAVELTTFATVRQATGEDWNGAQVILSTAVPRESATPPEIRPLRIWATEKGKEKKVLVRRDEMQQHAETAEPGQTRGGEGMAAANQGLSVQLTVPGASDVPGDGTATRLFVSRDRLPAHFAYRTVPKLSPFVFRVADATNTAPFPLLPGELDAFRTNGFMGHYALERTAMGAPLHITFGADEGLKVKRTVLKEIQRQTGLFGGNQRFSFAYKFELANYEGSARKIELSEHIPVSELDDVHVEIEDATSKGFKEQKDDGILTWKLTLAPGEKRTVELAFHVDVPSSYDTSSL